MRFEGLRYIRLTPLGALNPEESLLLERWAEPVQAGCRLRDRGNALAAVEKGFGIGELQSSLEARDDMLLPDPVESFIRQCAMNGKALKTVGSAMLIECRDGEVAATIAGGKMLVVRSEQLEKFRELVLRFRMAV